MWHMAICRCVWLSHQASGLGGTAVAGHDADQVATMKPVKERIIKVTFNADRHASMQWNFRPQQTEIFVRPAYMLTYLVLAGPSPGPEASLVSDMTVLVVFFPRWSQVRRHWPSTEPKTPQISPLLASLPTTLSHSRQDSISTKSR